MRQTIARPRDVTVGGQANEEDGNLVVTFHTDSEYLSPYWVTSLPLLLPVPAPKSILVYAEWVLTVKV